MRSRSKGNNNMQAMGCFETDHAQPRSKSPKARAVQYSGQQPMCSMYVQYSASSIRWRSGWSRGWSRFANDFRVKGGDGHGQLGSVRDHSGASIFLYGMPMGPVVQVDSYTKSRLPAAHPEKPRRDPEGTQNTQTTPPFGATWGRRGPRHSETSRPGDPADCNVLNWPAVVLFGFSLFSRHVVYGAVVHGRKRRRQSARSRHSKMTSFRHPCSIVRHCSSYELTHPSQ